MQLRSKSLILIVTGTLTFALLFGLLTEYTFNSIFVSGLKKQGHIAAELMRLTITHEMDEGNSTHIRPYIENLKGVPGLTYANVVPASNVIKQFKMDTSKHVPASSLEKKVFASGKEASEITEGEHPTFHFAIPYIASSRGLHNCLSCHEAKEGDVLGAVSLSIDITEQHQAANRSMAMIALLFLGFGAIMAFSLRRLMSPLIATATELSDIVDQAEKGDFSGRLKKRSSDEVGDIAEKTNHFLQTLENSFGSISRKVEALISKSDDEKDHANLLDKTVRVVDDMVGAVQFRQAVESDRDLEEVYERLSNVIIKQFGLSRFSLYEVSNSKNQLHPIIVKGLSESGELWCDREVLVDCDVCRAKRTAETVISVDGEVICKAFSGNKVQNEETLMHICLPLMLSGSVGGVLQLVFQANEADTVHAKLSTLKTYLAEVSPVIEAKRLMQSLKDASMRDPMTGLYNRRFLEGYLDTMLATADRQKTSIGILMCDVDFFKQINDTMGHDVGDTVLRTVAEILSQAVRTSDLVVRYGGEEFLALLIDSDEKKSVEVAERVRKTMEAHAFTTPTGPLKKTISVGVSLYPVDSDAFWECVKFSDVAMYAAKESGRNKILRFTKNMWKDGENY